MSLRRMPPLNEKPPIPGSFGAKPGKNWHAGMEIALKRKVKVSKKPEIISPAMTAKKFGRGIVGRGPNGPVMTANANARRRLKDFMAELQMAEGLFTADPVEMMIYIAVTGKDPLNHGKKIIDEEDRRIPLDIRIECARATARFVRPVISQIDVNTVNNSTPSDAAEVVNEDLMMDPAMRSAYEEIQTKLAAQIAEDPEGFTP